MPAARTGSGSGSSGSGRGERRRGVAARGRGDHACAIGAVRPYVGRMETASGSAAERAHSRLEPLTPLVEPVRDWVGGRVRRLLAGDGGPPALAARPLGDDGLFGP